MKSLNRKRTTLAPKGRRSQRGRPAKRGPKRVAATLVEFALVCNVLIVTIFTCMEFARMNMARNLAQDAAYFAARAAIVPGATAAEAEAEGERIMSAIFSSGYTVTCSPISDETEEVSVRVAVELDDVAFFLPMFLGGIQLESTANMQTERYSGYYEQ
ncbi:TadE/TadG family type IV pilus assembly protein [Aporhodopirellula aestuarii]|uniref:Pilus assembly protein n=1 Tax=Aporhodopirellula aestuarii TaxID=2950107 RepID=A0ABT0U6X9_9BACT|nr:TadE family protein [Aporhodopirellula aestuarii]MCM2372429.1 pilus assembly protein [Aporhodopirellula aestuarii]